MGPHVLLHPRGAQPARESVGVVLGRQQHHAHVHALAEDHVDAAQRGVNAGRVAVVDHRDVARETVQEAYLLRRERRARRGHHVLHPGLVHGDHVEIPLHQDGAILLLYGLLREVEAVELAFLAVYFAFGRVLVLGHVLVRAERAAAERHDAARDVVHREDDPLAEAVVERAVALAPQRQSRRHEELLAIARFQGVARHAVAAPGAETEAELADRGVGHAALLAEIGQAHALTLGIAREDLREVVRGPAVEGEHALAVVVAVLLLGRQLLLAHLDAVALGHGLQRLGIADALVLHDERHGIAALSAAEAFEESLRGRHDERGGLFVMERTACLIVHALAPERDVFADDFHDVRGGIDAVYRFPVDHSRKDTKSRAQKQTWVRPPPRTPPQCTCGGGFKNSNLYNGIRGFIYKRKASNPSLAKKLAATR